MKMRLRRAGGQRISAAGLALLVACALPIGWAFSDALCRFLWLWLSLHS
jgi:hypothetical protein